MTVTTLRSLALLLISSLPLSVSAAQQTYLKASNTDGIQAGDPAGDLFGWATAISGDTLVVSSFNEDGSAIGVDGDQDDEAAPQAGAVYVFVRFGSSWVQQAYLKASNSGAGDHFGHSLAIDGDTLVVGALGEASDSIGVGGDESSDAAPNSGAAYVFVRSGSTWSQEAYLKASNSEAGDRFGYAVAISGETIAVSSAGEASSSTGVNGDEADNSAAFAGAAYVFVRSAGQWTQEAYIKASNTDAFDTFGGALGLSGDLLVVTSPSEQSAATGIDGNQNDNSQASTGAAYVFARSGSSWSQSAYLKASNADMFDQFGHSVAISGATLVVGANGEMSAAQGVNGDQSNNGASNSGAAYVFVLKGSTWSQQAYLKASNSTPGVFFGQAVSLSGNRLVVGATGDSSTAMGVNGDQTRFGAPGAGAAHAFVRTGSNWHQHDYIKATNTDIGDQFGFSVGVSGNTLVAGAVFEAGNATGVDGAAGNNLAPDSGAAFVTELTPFFGGSPESVSLAVGGQQLLSLDADSSRSGWFYFVLGSASGTAPGADFGNGVILPLNLDPYLYVTLLQPNASYFDGFRGQLDGDGRASATMTIPANSDPALAGLVLHHAYLLAEVFGVTDFASGAVALQLVL